MRETMKAAIFDMDGTLIDSMAQWRKLNVDFVRSHGITPTLQQEKEMFSLTGRKAVEYYKETFGIEADFGDLLKKACSGMIAAYSAGMPLKPGTKAYGILGILIQVWYDVEYLFTVDENVFSPPPKVKSAVVRMVRNNRESMECNEELFKKIVKGTFNQRRKKLRNSIQQIVGKESPLLADPVLDKRPEQLSIDDFIELTNKVERELA